MNKSIVKNGDKIRIITMQGEPQYNGKIGVVNHIDDIGQLHGTWGGLAVVPTEDKFEVIKDKVCDICGKTFDGYGNNPAPFKGERCCDECNAKHVIPMRICGVIQDPTSAVLFKTNGTLRVV